MKVVFVAPFGLRQKTTLWARILPLAQVLVDQGHAVQLLIPPWDSPQDAGRRWTEGGVEVVNVELSGGLPAIMGRLLRGLERAQPDLVHIVKPRAYAGLVQWRLWHQRQRPPLVLDIDDWEQAWAPINGYRWPLARFLAWQEEWGIRHADGITAASRWLEGRAQSYAPQTPRLYLPNGVTLPAQPPERPALTRPPTLLYFTRFVEVTPEWLAACWRTIAQQVPGARMIVAGSPVQPGLDRPFIATVARYAPDGAAVEWRGFVPPAELEELYARAAVAIFPAAPVPLQQAKCSVRLATTLLHALPVVASATGEQAYYGADGAARLVAADATAEEFARAVVALLDSEHERGKMVRRARGHLTRHYRWDLLGSELLAFYAMVLQTQRGER